MGKPFSGKKKKEQLKAKRAMKGELLLLVKLDLRPNTTRMQRARSQRTAMTLRASGELLRV